MAKFPAKIFAVLAVLLTAGTAAFADEKAMAGIRFTNLCVTAKGRSFQYAKNGSVLTVNGTIADEEAVDTLLRHLSSALSGDETTFTPEEAPIMTVTFTLGGETGNIAFYPDKEDHHRVYVVSSENGVSITEAWQVGTILLACEGSQAAGENEED